MGSMRPDRRILLVAIAITVLTVIVIITSRPNATKDRPDNLIHYESFGTTTEVDCADGKSLNVAGSNNKLTVKGTCESVDVAGADNRITVNEIDKSLTITGLDNIVTYKNGEPKVDDRGLGNTVKKG